jgi:hypothetical protein
VGQVPSSQADAPPQPNLGVPALRVSTFQEGLFLNCFAQFTHVMVAQLLGLNVFTTSVAQASNDWIVCFLALRYLSDSEHLIDKLCTLISLGRLGYCTPPPPEEDSGVYKYLVQPSWKIHENFARHL